MTPNEETEKATNEVIKILEEWGRIYINRWPIQCLCP